MKKTNKMTPKGIVLLLALAVFVGLCAAGCSNGGGIQEVLTEEEYIYVNPDETRAEPDAGIVIDGVLDEAVYQNNNWLYLHNNEGNDVNIAMTSYYGEKGMYFVYDVTESVPIYVNLDRASYMNSCIEMYFAPSSVTSMGQNSVFEIDMLPTGDMVFKKSNGKGGYVNVATTDDIMAYLGATTKGGEVNTESCYGYCLELFIPWEYMEWNGMNVEAMKESFVYVDPAHITSFNYTGTDTSVDRYWYFYAQQQGAAFSNVFQYFRFDGTGALGTVPVELAESENCTIEADPSAIPGVKTSITIKPNDGFALSSIVVNGEERIQNAFYNADGSVELVIRPGEEGLKISAAAETVTAGTKTLSGTVRLANIEADTLEGVLASYKGPQGEKPLTLDENGNFRLEGLEQGYYTLEIEKEGYQDISRGIYLNRDIDAELVLEFDTFFTQNGSAFVLDEQNSNVVHKFGGTGYIMSNKAYNRFTYEMKIRYDKELAEEADTDAFTQQRTGMRILFSNGKYWYIDMLKEGDSYIVQYAKHSNSIFDKWTTICKLNAAQIAKYTGEEGITLRVVRDGQFVGIYLDGILLRVEKLDYEYARHTAQLGMESWSANRGVMEIPYSIDGGVRVPVAASDFYRPGDWNITGQYGGYVTLNNGGDGGWLNFGEKYVDSDVSIIVRDDPKIVDDNGGFRTVIKHTFDNGKTASFSVFYNENGQYVIQSMGDTVFGWGTHHVLSDEEVAKLRGEGIELRVVRIGTEISCYLDGNEIVSGADLTKAKDGSNTGIKADMPATVSIRHYGDKGVTVVIPYEMEDKLDYVKVTSVPDAAGNQVALNKDNYLRGDIVSLSDSDEGSHYPYAMKVNGKTVTLDKQGNYAFVAEEDEYIVESEFAERVFKNSAEWNEVQQNVGTLTVPGSDGDSGWIESYSASYKDVDLKLTLRDQDTAADNYRAAVRMAFGNGEYVTFTLTNDQSNSDAPTNYTLQNMGGSIQDWAQVKGYSLSEAQVAKLRSEEGLEFRVVRVGDVADLFVGGEHVHEFDLSVNKNGKASNVSNETTNIQLRFYGNTGKDVEVPFSITEDVAFSAVTDHSDKTLGSVVAQNKNIVIGEKVTLKATAKNGYYCGGMTVDGKPAAANADGTYSFVATKANHTVEGIFYKLIFKDNNKEWDVYDQHNGNLNIPKADGDTGWVESYRSDYQDFDFRVTLRDYNNTNGDYRAAVRLAFSNNKDIAITVTNNRDDQVETLPYELQTMGGSMYNWKDSGYDLTEAQAAALQSEAGLELRIVRVGDIADVYIGGVHAYEYDLSSGGVADLGAQIRLRFYGNSGKDVEVPFTISEEVPAFVTVTDASGAAEGSVAVQNKNVLIGEKVVLKATAKSGYYCTGMTVDGTPITANTDGTYSFIATKAEHIVKGVFFKMIFQDGNANWNAYRQHEGVMVVKNSGNTGYVSTYDNYNQFTLTVHDPNGSIDSFGVAGQFKFENGKIVNIQVTKWNGKYYIKSANGSSIYGGNQNYLTIGTDNPLHGKITGNGIKLTAMRAGTELILLADNVQLTGLWRDGSSLDLTKDSNGNATGITADMPAKVEICSWCKANIELPFELKEEQPAHATVTIPAMTNGTVTADKRVYLPGETVTLTVAGNAGYAHNSLTVNGQSVMTDLYGKYSFVINEDTTVNATFAPSVFNSTVTGWLLENQHYGQIAVVKNTGNSSWGDFADQYGDIDITLTTREFENTNELARTLVRFMFTNGKTMSISVAKNTFDGGKTYDYTIESIGGNNLEAAGYDYYTLTSDQIAKFTGEGIEFRVVRSGTKVYVYLDDVMVVNGYDLTKGGTTGITADTKMTVTIRQYDTPDIVAVYDDFRVVATAPSVNVNIAQTAHGTVTADKNSYKLGDTVKLTVAGDSGYYYTGLYVDGQLVTVGWDGTYSFVAAKESCEVSCGFAPTVFTGGDMRHWDITKHQVGELRMKSHASGHSGWIDYTGICNDVTTVVKNHNVSAKDFTMTYMFKFSNGETFNIRLHNTDGASTYKIQSMTSTLFGSWKTRYTLNDTQKAAVTGGGIEFRVIILNSTAHVYLDGVKVCEYVFTKDVSSATSTVTLRMDGNLNNDVYIPYELKNTTKLP